MSLLTINQGATVIKTNDPLEKNIVLHNKFIIILPLYALNNKNTPVASWTKRVISFVKYVCIKYLAISAYTILSNLFQTLLI